MSVADEARTRRSEVWRLGLLFGAIYFLQGIGEPTDGLIAQPARSLLRNGGRSVAEIATLMAVLAIPWSLKPLYGLLTDFVPIFGTRRKGYLVLSSAAMSISLLGLFAFPLPTAQPAALLGWLLVPAVAVALSDVAADALLVERSQPLGITGVLQAVQWGCLYASGIVTGLLGGALCENHREYLAFLVCGGGGLLTLILVLACVRDPPRTAPRPSFRAAIRTLFAARKVLGIGAFLFLWNFNPFSNSLLHAHITGALGLSQMFYGWTVALTAMSSIGASVAYGLFCQRVPMSRLIHASIALGVVSTLAYVLVDDERSVALVTLVAAATYMTATLIQLDLAARICPAEAAGTVFALLMALENLSASVSSALEASSTIRGPSAGGTGAPSRYWF